MAYTPPGRSESGGMDFSYLEDEAGYGLVTFAGVMLMIVAVAEHALRDRGDRRCQLLRRRCALRLRRPQHVGLVPLALGVLQFFAAFAIWRGVVGSLVRRRVRKPQCVLQMLWITAYPVLAMTILALDLTVIYGLLAYGGRRRAARAARERAKAGSAG